MKVAMVVGCHPDDIEIGCGGTLAYLKSLNYKIVFIVVTSGGEGSLDIKPHELISIRKEEAIKSAAILGAEVYFLEEPDGLTTYQDKSKIKLISLIRQYKPEYLFSHGPSDQFPDHQVVYKLVNIARIVASGPWYSEADGEPFRVPNFLGYEVWNPINKPQMIVDIDQHFETKFQMLSQHKTQTSGVRYLEAIKGLASYRGSMSQKSKYAEAFEVLGTNFSPT